MGGESLKFTTSYFINSIDIKYNNNYKVLFIKSN
jgi:uncharacterized protein YqkB